MFSVNAGNAFTSEQLVGSMADWSPARFLMSFLCWPWMHKSLVNNSHFFVFLKKRTTGMLLWWIKPSVPWLHTQTRTLTQPLGLNPLCKDFKSQRNAWVSLCWAYLQNYKTYLQNSCRVLLYSKCVFIVIFKSQCSLPIHFLTLNV